MQRVPTKSIADAIALFIRENHLEEGLLRARVANAWDAAVGNPAYTSSTFYKDKVLTCRMTSSVVRQQARFRLESYRQQINTLLGGEYVEKIILQ